MMNQCIDFGVEFVFDQIVDCDLSQDEKTIRLASGKTLTAKTVVIASGASSRKLDVKGERELTGKGVSYCATCDGAFFKNKTVAVIGGGNTAAEDALYLEKLAKKVYIVHRRDKLRADAIVAKRLLSSTIQPIWDSVVQSVEGEDKVTELTLKNVKTDDLTSLSVDGVFVAIGQTPNSQGFGDVDVTKSGYILTDERMRTNLQGVYAVGDVREKACARWSPLVRTAQSPPTT